MERGQGGVAELPAVTVGDRGVAHVLDPGREFARCSLEEHRQSAGVPFDGLPHRPDVVGRHEVVLPGERRRMAGVVDDCGQPPSRGRRHPPRDERVVGCGVRVEAAHDPTVGGPGGVGQVTVGRQSARAAGPVDRRRLERRDGLPGRPHRGVVECGQVCGEHVAPRPVRLGIAERRRRVRVREAEQEPLGRDAEGGDDAAAERPLLRGARPPAEVGVDEHERRVAAANADRQGREAQRAVHAAGRVVAGRAPIAAVDAGRRRDVGTGHARQAGERGMGDDHARAARRPPAPRGRPAPRSAA